MLYIRNNLLAIRTIIVSLTASFVQINVKIPVAIVTLSWGVNVKRIDLKYCKFDFLIYGVVILTC